MARQKFYAVWIGKVPGVYSDWKTCKTHVHEYPQAEYKGYTTRDAAERAWRAGSRLAAVALDPPPLQISLVGPVQTRTDELVQPLEKPGSGPKPVKGLTVDASCIGNPGKTEYQGVDLASGQRVFRVEVGWGTNNIGEFLALVHGLAYLSNHENDGPIFSDSLLAIQWVHDGLAKSKHSDDPRAAYARSLIKRAEAWLRTHPQRAFVQHWKTRAWGEIPADFGRK